MDKETFIRHYCANYQILENKVLESSEYVSIEGTNYGTYSSNFIILFLSICSEIDSIAGEYCKIISKSNDNIMGMINKIDTILSKQPNLRHKRVVTIPPFEEQSFVPFQKLEKQNSSWWTDYNNIKHNRTGVDEASGRYNYQKGTLKNVINALASLYILIFLIGKEYGFDENNPPITSRFFAKQIL